MPRSSPGGGVLGPAGIDRCIILTGFTNSMHDFSPRNKLNTSILTLQWSVLLPCIRQQIKGEQSDEIRHSSFISSKPHEAAWSKIHRYALHYHDKYKQMSLSISRFRLDWRIRNREALKSRRFLSNTLRHFAQKRWVIWKKCHQAGISPEGGLEVGQTLWFF